MYLRYLRWAPGCEVSVFLLNLLIAQLSQSYHDVFEDMQATGMGMQVTRVSLP